MPARRQLVRKTTRKTSRLRRSETTASDTKVAILGAANLLAGIFGVFENLERGDLVGDAIRKEITCVRRRAGALRSVSQGDADDDADPEGEPET